MKRIILIIFLLILSACGSNSTSSTNKPNPETNSPEPTDLGFNENCSGDTEYSKIQNQVWTYSGNDAIVSIHFGDSILNIDYTCTDVVGADIYYQQAQQRIDYIVNKNSQTLLFLDPAMFEFSIQETNKICQFNMGQVVDYSFSGKCLVIHDDKKRNIYFEGQ